MAITPNYNEKNSGSYEPRISTLLSYASEEGIRASDESIRDFNFFVDTVVPTSKALLIIMDNGNLRATWKAEGRKRLSLEFVGNRTVDYVVFIPEDVRGQPFERVGMGSFDEMRQHIKRWGLWNMVAS